MRGDKRRLGAAEAIYAGVYVRCSTSDQQIESQEAELRRYADGRGWTIYKVYSDRGQSGAKASRPALDELIADCRRGKIDIVLVWKFDRFARSLKQLIVALEEFGHRGVDFVSSTEQIDTSTPSGKCFFQIIGAIAEFERNLISERVRSGLRHAQARGKRLGRPPLYESNQEKERQLKAERVKGKASLRALARKYGVSLYRAYSLCRTQTASI